MSQKPPERDDATQTMDEKLAKLKKAKSALEALCHNLTKIETNLRSLQQSATLLQEVLHKLQQLPPAQRAQVAQAIQKAVKPLEKKNLFFISSTLH